MAGSNEDGETVSAFFQDMRHRGLGDPPLVASDGVPGIIKARATAAYRAPSRAIAGDLAEGLVRDYESQLPSAVACFMDDFEACIAYLMMPVNHRRAIRTTNLLEQLFVEERRRPIEVTAFERRQMETVRQELDQEYQAQTSLAKQTSKDATGTNLSSSSRT